MPIKSIQQRFAQVGVIRLGVKAVSARGKEYPKKLETFRFTSPSRTLIEAVAAVYGGTVEPWQSNTGPQFQVLTPAREIPVLVVPQKIDPNYELWGNGYRSRMCDGETEQIRKVACETLCRPEQRECKPTTRLSLMLADIPSLGTWKLESHGWNAAAELPTLGQAIEAAPQPIPARLELQKRAKKVFDPTKPQKEQVESRDFLVPVLHFDFVTPAQAFGGQIGAASRAALAGGDGPQAIGAAPAPVATPAPSMSVDRALALIRAAKSVAQLDSAGKDIKDAGLSDQKVRDAWMRRKQELTPAPEPDPQPEPAAAPAPADEVVDAEIIADDDADEVWMQVQAVAGKAGMNSDAVETLIQSMFSKSSNEIGAAQMRELIAAIDPKAGKR